MTDEPDTTSDEPQITRRKILVSGGIAAGAGLALAAPAVVAALNRQPSAAALVRRPDAAGAPPPEQVHVQFGADAASQMAVSWAAQARVARPRLRVGLADRRFGLEVPAEERVYREVMTGETVYTYHARVSNLRPDTAYAYEVLHEGAHPLPGTFRTGPLGRSRGFRFTSFGDQSVPVPVGKGPASPNAGYIVDAVDALDPLFHLMNGDLSYANSSDMPVQTWAAYFTNNMRSARHRPWMPAVGNHENEVGNASHGLVSYQTRFELPDNGSAEFRGNWYAFTVGSVRVLSISNDDVCVEDGGFSGVRCKYVPGYRTMGLNPYIRGYSRGQQRAWLARELAAARQSAAIDWIVICMHQVVMSSAHFNGADIGIRREFVPLFDRYGVDLIVAGHEHHFERTFPVRGILPGSNVLTPAPQQTNPAEIDTRNGYVHMIIGGGGNSHPTQHKAFDHPHDGVVTVGLGPGGPTRQRQHIHVTEPAPWSAYRDLTTPYGFASFDVVPTEPGGTTSISVTHYGAAAGSGKYSPVDRFVMRKPVRAPDPVRSPGQAPQHRVAHT